MRGPHLRQGPGRGRLDELRLCENTRDYKHAIPAFNVCRTRRCNGAKAIVSFTDRLP